jgi:hypothetical protein
MWISLAVTPCAGEPEGFPFLQTTSLVPNAPALAPEPELELEDELGGVVLLEVALDPLRPHAATAIAITQTNATHRKRLTSPPLRRGCDFVPT